jgi:hypothetical protein
MLDTMKGLVKLLIAMTKLNKYVFNISIKVVLFCYVIFIIFNF